MRALSQWEVGSPEKEFFCNSVGIFVIWWKITISLKFFKIRPNRAYQSDFVYSILKQGKLYQNFTIHAPMTLGQVFLCQGVTAKMHNIFNFFSLINFVQLTNFCSEWWWARNFNFPLGYDLWKGGKGNVLLKRFSAKISWYINNLFILNENYTHVYKRTIESSSKIAKFMI